MLRLVLKIVGGLVFVLLLLIAGTSVWALTRWDRTFEAATPETRASGDSSVIARGRYLAYGPAHCVECHVNRGEWDSLVAGATPPLAGGMEFPAPPLGVFRTPNLTPDTTHGIGRFSDGQLARALRYGVRHDGRALLPFMEFQNLSDEDVAALISFLRSQAPVSRAVADHEFQIVGKTAMAFLIKPAGPSANPPARSPAESATVERGAYLANAVASCAACHTKRNPMDGSYTGPRFAGGGEFPGESSMVFVSPNITQLRFTEDQFVARFQQGPVLHGSPMPWAAFKRMSDNDMRALYRYLRTLPADTTDPGPSMRSTAG